MPRPWDDAGVDSAPTERDGCPPEEKLLLFVARFLPEADTASLSRHLDTCTSCRRKVTAIGATPGIQAAAQAPLAVLQPAAVAGQRLGRFALTRMLGRGGMGEVWAARDPELDREVAIKLLRLDARGLDDDGHARLRREAQAMARLTHPNIVRIYELGSDGDLLFCAMELIDGETLRRPRLARARPGAAPSGSDVSLSARSRRRGARARGGREPGGPRLERGAPGPAPLRL